LNLETPHFMQFITKNSPPIDLDISYTNNLISEVHDTKFLGIYVDNTLSWKYHVGNTQTWKYHVGNTSSWKYYVANTLSWKYHEDNTLS
jgi:hypothetical protein